jgi:hypothetical protein
MKSEAMPVRPPGGMPPPRQTPYAQALRLGFEVLCSRALPPDRSTALGITVEDGIIRLPALNRLLTIDLSQRRVQVENSEPARATWAVLAVHYLCATDLAPDPRVVSFSHFQDCRSYLSVFGKRIVERFLATSGRTAESFAQAAAQLGGRKVAGSGTGYAFDVFPRVPITIIRYDGDEEIRPGASVIYRADAERLLPAEDRVVAAELLLDALAGKPMTE